MTPIVMVAITGVWNRSETVVSFSGASRSKDQANMFLVPIMKPVGVHQMMASRKQSAMKTSSHCGPGRKLTSAGRYGWNDRVHVHRAAAERQEHRASRRTGSRSTCRSARRRPRSRSPRSAARRGSRWWRCAGRCGSRRRSTRSTGTRCRPGTSRSSPNRVAPQPIAPAALKPKCPAEPSTRATVVPECALKRAVEVRVAADRHVDQPGDHADPDDHEGDQHVLRDHPHAEDHHGR